MSEHVPDPAASNSLAASSPTWGAPDPTTLLAAAAPAGDIIPVGEVVDEFPAAHPDTPLTPVEAAPAPAASGRVLVEPDVSLRPAPVQPSPEARTYDSLAEMTAAEAPLVAASRTPASAAVPLVAAGTPLADRLRALLASAGGDEEDVRAQTRDTQTREMFSQLASELAEIRATLPHLVGGVQAALSAEIAASRSEAPTADQLETLHAVHTSLRSLGGQQSDLAERLGRIEGVVEALGLRGESPAAEPVDAGAHAAALAEAVELRLAPTLASLGELTASALAGLQGELETARSDAAQAHVRSLEAFEAAVSAAVETRLDAATGRIVSEVSAHVDAAILTLAQTLLRRRAGTGSPSA